jgi:hypothetical protein
VSNEAPAPVAGACHRGSSSETAHTATESAPSGYESSRDPAGCVMTSCGSEAPMALTAQGQPYLAASLAAEPYRDPSLEAVAIAHPLARFSLEASPPTPPPES